MSLLCPTNHHPNYHLSVLKRCVPKTLAFAFGLRLRSKTRCFKTRVLGRRLPNGKPQERLRFRDLRSKTLAFKNALRSLFLRFKDFPQGQGLRSGPLRSKNAAFCVCVLKPTKIIIKKCYNTLRVENGIDLLGTSKLQNERDNSASSD